MSTQVEKFWYDNWSLLISLPDIVLEKIQIALKYNMEYEDFIKLVTNEYGCRFCCRKE